MKVIWEQSYCCGTGAARGVTAALVGCVGGAGAGSVRKTGVPHPGAGDAAVAVVGVGDGLSVVKNRARHAHGAEKKSPWQSCRGPFSPNATAIDHFLSDPSPSVIVLAALAISPLGETVSLCFS